jgi:hypothetical protein
MTTAEVHLMEPEPIGPQSKETLDRELGALRSIIYMLELIAPDRRPEALAYTASVLGVNLVGILKGKADA